MLRTHAFKIQRVNLAMLILVVLASLMAAAFRPAAAATAVSLDIVSVEKGQSVTIRVAGMPANKEFRVLMNVIGTQGAGGVSAGTGKTDKDGAFTKNFAIPAGLKREAKIAIRIEATDQTGWYAYNWFVNDTRGTTSSSVGGSSIPPAGSTAGSGNLAILEVEEDVSVVVRANGLPANRSFQAWFDWKNRAGVVRGAQAGTVRSDADGKLATTIQMPAVLQDRNEVRLRLQAAGSASPAAYVWFLNADSDEETGGGAPAGSDLGIPYLKIGAVVAGESVSVEAFNFPRRAEFDVYMGRMGTQAEDGIYVGTVKSGKSGNSFTAELDIPNKLKNRDEIAIRFEAADGSGYYAYSWFENSTTAAE